MNLDIWKGGGARKETNTPACTYPKTLLSMPFLVIPTCAAWCQKTHHHLMAPKSIWHVCISICDRTWKIPSCNNAWQYVALAATKMRGSHTQWSMSNMCVRGHMRGARKERDAPAAVLPKRNWRRLSRNFPLVRYGDAPFFRSSHSPALLRTLSLSLLLQIWSPHY